MFSSCLFAGPLPELCESTFTCNNQMSYFALMYLLHLFSSMALCSVCPCRDFFIATFCVQECFGGERHDIWWMIPNFSLYVLSISDVTFFSVLQLFVLCFKEKDATEDENEVGQHMFQQITRTYSPKRMQD